MENSPIHFSEFMEFALYDERVGYYTKGADKIGRDGDFFTSVSVGSLFGELLAIKIEQSWRRVGEPEKFYLFELGGNNATLAVDILSALKQNFVKCFESVRYAIIEHLPNMKEIQRTALAEFLPMRASSFSSFDEAKAHFAISDDFGIIFGNELLDALPVNVAKVKSSRWVELNVVQNGEKWEWIDGNELGNWPGAPPVEARNYPEGYITEWNAQLIPFFQNLAKPLKNAELIFIDYAKPQSSYYDVGRKNGTLRTFRKHELGENPLENPGEFDITADVDMDAVLRAAEMAGFCGGKWNQQGRWLISLAVDKLKSLDGAPIQKIQGFNRQFQTLTHPSSLGTRFSVFEATKFEI